MEFLTVFTGTQEIPMVTILIVVGVVNTIAEEQYKYLCNFFVVEMYLNLCSRNFLPLTSCATVEVRAYWWE